MDYHFEKAGERVWAIFSPTNEILYLVVGDQKAFLIDTASGYKDLKAEVETITNLPVTVLLTHGHPDHAGGVGGFKPAYLSPLDWDLYKEWAASNTQKELIEQEMQKPVLDEEVNWMDPDFAFSPLQDGDVFDAGGIHIEAAAFPGHTQGSMAFLIPEEEILVTGDGANTNTWLFLEESSSAKDYLQAVISLQEKMKGRYSRIFTSHRDVDVTPDLLEEARALCEKVLDGSDDAVDVVYMGLQAKLAKACRKDFSLEDGTQFNMTYSAVE